MLKLEISSSKSKNKQIYPVDPTGNKTYDCRQMFEESQCQKNMNVEINCLNRKASGLLQVSQKRLEKQRQSIAKCWGEPWISQMCPQKTMDNQKLQHLGTKDIPQNLQSRQKKVGSVKSETFQKVEKQVLQKDRADMFQYLPYVSMNFLQKTISLQGGQRPYFSRVFSYRDSNDILYMYTYRLTHYTSDVLQFQIQ